MIEQSRDLDGGEYYEKAFEISALNGCRFDRV